MYFYFFLGEVGFQEFVEHELTFVFLITNVIATVFFPLNLKCTVCFIPELYWLYEPRICGFFRLEIMSVVCLLYWKMN